MKKSIWFTALLTALFLAASVTMASAGRLVIKGSTTVLPITQKISEAYMAANPEVKISLSGGGSGNGIKAVIDQTSDIGNSSRFIKGKEVKLAVEKGVLPVPHRIALDCIVPVAHPGNPVTNLTLDQLKQIYLGKITNWKEVGGSDMKIVVISRDSSSGTFDAWKSLVMKKERVTPRALTQPSNGGLVTQVATTKGAIAYIALGYLNDEVKALDVNGVKGSAETTLNGRYPISRPLFMFTNGWPKGETLSFINFILSQKGQGLVEEAGSIPLY
ncbi:phosphate ABC transporter substrate-binding protein [Desulfoluna limicola]|uniref:Phosphate-binding protein n=1 Tax=Desulfoluna limicola TaxID=2810562 RepID=A0ABM7PLG5_9BACT|nr:phosphate ABC transporter substrate-binding protein [Desulfoluna limicola]BCS98110.1 phosphate ABC transporter substrate-binding protein [Desulfoluna limicola]